MKDIYIILTHTGSLLSQIIKYYTRREFSHISIALDEDLKYMYSFGRLKPYNPFRGGFVHEQIESGTFKRFKNTTAIVYRLEIEEKQYSDLKTMINLMETNKEKYKFNIIGLFAVALHIKIKKDNSFYCAEFVKYLLETTNVETNLPIIIKPEDFMKIENMDTIYKGKLSEYNYRNKVECKKLETIKE